MQIFSVGSGFPGSFLARKLAHGGCFRVLLIEAGGMPSYDSVIPFIELGNMSKHTWDYMTVPQKNAARAMKEEVCYERKFACFLCCDTVAVIRSESEIDGGQNTGWTQCNR